MTDFDKHWDTFQWMVRKIDQLEKRIVELEAGKPRTVYECMEMGSERFETMLKDRQLLHLKLTEVRAIRIYHHREECLSTIWISRQPPIQKIRLLRTHDSKLKTMLARYEKGIAPHSRAIVSAMKTVVIHQPTYEGIHDVSPINNGVLELRTKENYVVYRQNRPLLSEPRRIRARGGGMKRAWFTESPNRRESLLVFKDHNDFEDVEEKHAYGFDMPINTGDDTAITAIL